MSTASKFADDLSRRLTHGLTEKELAWGAGVIDQALAPVRECLEGLRCEDSDCWCIHFGSEYHTEACLAAQQLWERLKIQ